MRTRGLCVHVGLVRAPDRGTLTDQAGRRRRQKYTESYTREHAAVHSKMHDRRKTQGRRSDESDKNEVLTS